jgi:hypothetical protein
MNLLIDTKSQSVLYAEACKDVIVIDFLFSFLTLPIGTVIKILSKGSMVGSVGNLYGSVEELDETYVCSARAKQAFLTPTGGKLQIPEAPAAPQQPPCTEVFRKKIACAPTTACAPPHIVVHFGSDDAPLHVTFLVQRRASARLNSSLPLRSSVQQLGAAPFLAQQLGFCSFLSDSVLSEHSIA